jgi:alpha-galactosidase
MTRKLVLIGAGSAVFTRGLVADLIVDSGEWDVALVDVDPQALGVAYGLAEKMVAARSAPVTLSRHLDRREALPGADFVVTTIAVGGRRAWEQDVFIPRRYGIFQPVGDTIMPGGISRAVRQIPAMVAIARDIGKLAPQARFFNYANPMAAICRAVHKATDTQIVGLCHGVKGGERELADLLGVEPARCRFTAVGMNHLAFFTEFTVGGEDAWPRVRERLGSARPVRGEALRRELFLQCGAWSVLNDRHLAEFFPQFHRDGTHPDGKLGVDLFSFEDCIAGGDRGYAAMADQAAGRVPLDESVLERQVGEHEQLVAIFRSLESADGRRYSVILPNAGQVTNLPRDFAVECPALISRDGIVPERVGDVPPFIRAAVEKALVTIELAVDAALEQDKEKFLQAIIADGSARSLADAIALADDLWEANAPYLAN